MPIIFPLTFLYLTLHTVIFRFSINAVSLLFLITAIYVGNSLCFRNRYTWSQIFLLRCRLFSDITVAECNKIQLMVKPCSMHSTLSISGLVLCRPFFAHWSTIYPHRGYCSQYYYPHVYTTHEQCLTYFLCR